MNSLSIIRAARWRDTSYGIGRGVALARRVVPRRGEDGRREGATSCDGGDRSGAGGTSAASIGVRTRLGLQAGGEQSIGGQGLRRPTGGHGERVKRVSVEGADHGVLGGRGVVA